MIFREYRPTDRESRDFGPGFMLRPPSKSRSMTEACNVKWAAPCHWTKWRRSCVPRRSPSRRKADGIQHLQMCGASTGTMNVYRLNSSDWEKDRVLGFVLDIEGISI